ncbi:hypothetical protein MMC18_006672 [Xylographa bjoerkii]|nr:hypothetical protein [Xylographa bjoerkii]
MHSLRDTLVGIQVKNFESRWYVPGKELNKVLSRTAVEAATISCGIEVHKRTEVVDLILKGAKKIFAVLVLIGNESSIVDFIENDSLQDQRLDSRLPFRRAELDEVLDENIAMAFHRTQWTVSAPIFRRDTSHRVLNDDTILPFSRNVKVGSGAFGTVFEITLDPNHQGIWRDSQLLQDLRLVRKEIDLPDVDTKPPNTSLAAKAPRKEDHVLSLLRLIKHPNIIQLVASYSYRGTYNLIFPRAAGDLGKYLSSSERSTGFESNRTILLACQGLCSAVAALHNYIAPDHDLHLKGYHHDLKPENILIKDGRFLLTDFGLSSLKEMTSKSKTLFKEINGFYIAPECQCIEEGFELQMIGQPADIWALGCILTLILIHMHMGASAIQAFQQERKTTVMNWTTYMFHTGGTLSPVVDTWLAKLEHEGEPDSSGLCKLIRSMLEAEPACRPNASKVLSRISFLAARMCYHAADHKLKLLSESSNDLTIQIEQTRFTLFGDAIGLGTNEHDWSDLQVSFAGQLRFETFEQYCRDLCQSLDAAMEAPQLLYSSEVSHRRLRTCIDQFWNLLSNELRMKCENSLERKIIDTDDMDALKNIGNELRDEPNYRKVALLAAIKYMTRMAGDQQMQNPMLKWNLDSILSLGPEINAQTTIACVKREGIANRDTLIHWMKYSARWTDEVGKELFLLVEAVAELLHESEKPSAFRALDCIGYYHNASLHSFGLIFDFPPIVNSIQGRIMPCTFSSLLHTTRGQDQQPTLGDKFCLARNLASSVYEWHKVDWLHKNLSAFNVLLFPQAFSSMAASIREPYIVGFNHSRPSAKNAFTQGPPVIPEQVDYSHPRYLREQRGYRREYDYYSIGLVLLEIGLWRTLKSLAASFTAADQSPEMFRHFLLSKYVTRLPAMVGSTYEGAVRACLTFDLGSSSRSRDGNAVDDCLTEFEARVVAPLGRCFA